MLVKILKKEKVGGYRLEPGTVRELDDGLAAELLKKGIVETLEQKRHINIGGTALSINAEAVDRPVLIRNVEG